MMELDMLRSGKKLTFKQNEELDDILRNIFTNNPNHWDNSPLYLDNNRDLNRVIKWILVGKINVYEHEFVFTAPNEDNEAAMMLYEYCREISRARTNILLPLVYYNAILYLDSLHLSFQKIDNSSKIMYMRKNRYDSILDKIGENISNPYFFYDFLRHDQNFDELETAILCECGSVNAYRVESGLIYNGNNYIIFPFPMNEGELTGKMYYFEMDV